MLCVSLAEHAAAIDAATSAIDSSDETTVAGRAAWTEMEHASDRWWATATAIAATPATGTDNVRAKAEALKTIIQRVTLENGQTPGDLSALGKFPESLAYSLAQDILATQA
jgi:hypothetical protein